jgi:hypothetical protein
VAERVLWLDSNIVRNATWVREIVELAGPAGVRVVVHAQVHLELCRQLREKFGAGFDPASVAGYVEAAGFVVEDGSYSREDAEAWAAQIHQRYPTAAAWKAAKLSAVRGQLPAGAALPARGVPMTTDWLIALTVERRGGFVAVDDKGEEWAALRALNPPRAMTRDETMAWLRALPPP